MEGYEAAIDAGQIPIAKGVTIDDEDFVRKAIIMALICDFRLDYQSIRQRFGVEVPSTRTPPELGATRGHGGRRFARRSNDEWHRGDGPAVDCLFATFAWCSTAT
ncbi:MAG: hypothetical protein U5O39_16055 [Gammaproteobacteria bacterium]|nr:hypothetical protein [Gammaproteobacteria bacterium]